MERPPIATDAAGPPEALPSQAGFRHRAPVWWAACEALRAHHWIKNLLVFFPVLFASRYADPQAWCAAGWAFLCFCVTASAVYVLNDLVDRDLDRLHPRKCRRPIASGRLHVRLAIGEFILLAALSAGLTLAGGGRFIWVIGAYVLLQLAYQLKLKQRMLLDAIALACGFVLRAVAGAVATHVDISPWLIICTFSLCLFLGFCKRHCETLAIGDAHAAAMHRNTLAGYTPQLLNHLITLSAGLAVISFLLYATSERTINTFGTHLFVYTMPLVIYGICRIAMQSMRGACDGPTELILHDRAVLLTAVMWLAMAALIIVYGRRFEAWFASNL